MSELLPCPRCNGTVEILTKDDPQSYDYDGGDRYRYRYAKIGCFCGIVLSVYNDDDRTYYPYKDALNFAIAAWNTRYERTCHIIEKDQEPGLYCSECGALIEDRYCSHCGARVEGSEDETS